ncbi:MAG: SOS response-associated peptidase [Gammaproteobacteria bacterium]|nr:SOS response-associated peptidase [Gammaproteobacteria bacterium]
MNVTDHPGIQKLLDYLGLAIPAFPPRFNIAPGASLVVVMAPQGKPELASMDWGLIPAWAKQPKLLINARRETIWQKGSFKKLIAAQRVVIPITGFYEWHRDGTTKTPYYITPKDAPAFALAGIYQITPEAELQCCVITTGSDHDTIMRPIHDRMPVLLPPGAMTDWLQSQDKAQLDSLMVSNEPIKATKVSEYVNRASHEGPECVKPV